VPPAHIAELHRTRVPAARSGALTVLSHAQLQVAELAKSKLDPPKRLAELAARHWGELDAGTRVWDRPAAEVAALQRIALADLRAFFQVGPRHPVLHDS
jgi:hypothetical protein